MSGIKGKTQQINTKKTLKELEKLLEKQMAAFRSSDLETVEKLFKKTNVLIKEFNEQSFEHNCGLEAKQRRIMNLYRQMLLALQAEKEKSASELKRIKTGSRTIGVYKNQV